MPVGTDDVMTTPSEYPLLGRPFTIGHVELKNRVVFQPHYTALGTLDGMPSADHVAYHSARAAGGVGLIVFESQAVHPTGKMAGRFVHAWDPNVVPYYVPLTDAVHDHGAKIFSQLTHAGHTTLVRPPPILWAPSEMAEPSSRFVAKAMDLDDIAATIRGFGLAAKHSLQGNFDGIEVKVAHDGLLRSFASPFFNRRSDAYGGSFENRMRLSIQVLSEIREATRGQLPVGVRLCLDEFTPFGYELDYGLAMAAHLEESGLIDYINCDAGSFSSFWMEIPPAAVPAGSFNGLNAKLKALTKLPVIAFGRIAPLRLAEEILANGQADLIGFARQLIADPDTVNKLLSGKGNLVRPCVACNDACIYQVSQELAIRCIHNPAAGRERAMADIDARPLSPRKRVVVVGGGPAGMKVAEVASKRGHAVTLIEREETLGGLVRFAARQPEHSEIAGVTVHLEEMIRSLGVEILTNTVATPETIAALSPEVVVIATGSEANLPPNLEPRRLLREPPDRSIHVLPKVSGLDLPFVYSSDEVLSGAAALTGRVVVYDASGHWEGAGTAEYLRDQGCEVEIICPAPMVAADIESGNRTLFYRRAAIKGIAIRAGLALESVEQGGLIVRPVFGGKRTDALERYMLFSGDSVKIDGFDALVVTSGRRTRIELYNRCKNLAALKSCQILRAGDCVAPRLIESNLLEAHTLATNL